MKYCYTCKRFFTNEFRFCSLCGRSFGVRYCRRGRHINAIDAHYCRECGSSDLSTPVKKPPDSTRAKAMFITCAFLAATVALGFVLWSLSELDSLPPPIMFIIIVLGALVLFCWSSFRGSV
jgi:RNA polymerase subunit RPABC4/transcription elongation factor Spt4